MSKFLPDVAHRLRVLATVESASTQALIEQAFAHAPGPPSRHRSGYVGRLGYTCEPPWNRVGVSRPLRFNASTSARRSATFECRGSPRATTAALLG